MAETEVDTFRIQINENGCVSGWCESAKAITGFAKDEVQGMELMKILESDDVDTVSRAILDCRGGETSVVVQLPLWSKGGLRTVVDCLLHLETEGITFVGCSVPDMDHKVARASNGIYIGVSKQGQVVDWNTAAELASGYSKAEVLGAQIKAIFEDGSAAEATRAMNLAVSRRCPITFPCSFTDKFGERREITMTANARYGSAGDVVVVDITNSSSMSTLSQDTFASGGQYTGTSDSLPSMGTCEPDDDSDVE